jgi:hypothetical protein
VQRAEVIVWARAEGLANTPARQGALAGNVTRVRFSVLQILKGDRPSTEIEFKGILRDSDDRNDRPIPYDVIRPGGRIGTCFALTYRPGAEYLLLLGRGEHSSYAEPNELTPYWTPLGPTNEQLLDGARDPWYRWVIQQISK